jgi:hypothetical protein
VEERFFREMMREVVRETIHGLLDDDDFLTELRERLKPTPV